MGLRIEIKINKSCCRETQFQNSQCQHVIINLNEFVCTMDCAWVFDFLRATVHVYHHIKTIPHSVIRSPILISVGWPDECCFDWWWTWLSNSIFDRLVYVRAFGYDENINGVGFRSQSQTWPSFYMVSFSKWQRAHIVAWLQDQKTAWYQDVWWWFLQCLVWRIVFSG